MKQNDVTQGRRLDCQAARNEDRLACDPAGIIRSKESYRRGDIFGLSRAAERSLGDRMFFKVAICEAGRLGPFGLRVLFQAAGASVSSHPLDTAAGERTAEQAGGVSLNRLQHLLGMDTVIRNRHGCDHRILPGIKVIDLGYCYVEAVTQTVLQTLDNVPLLFERV